MLRENKTIANLKKWICAHVWMILSCFSFGYCGEVCLWLNTKRLGYPCSLKSYCPSWVTQGWLPQSMWAQMKWMLRVNLCMWKEKWRSQAQRVSAGVCSCSNSLRFSANVYPALPSISKGWSYTGCSCLFLDILFFPGGVSSSELKFWLVVLFLPFFSYQCISGGEFGAKLLTTLLQKAEVLNKP